MCCSCWHEHGAHRLDTPAIRAAVALIDAVYLYSCVGGNLHVVLDDDNLEDHSLAFCATQIAKGGFEGDSPEQLAAERACLTALEALTYDERVSALGLWNRCWKPSSE